MNLNLPQANIAEITLIGTGGGYGESIVVHYGNGKWVVIDSCIDPYSKKCLPLEYLQAIGVNLKEEVRMILCTHWHDDHILGLSQLLHECDSSVFCMARPNDLRKFLQLVKLDYRKIDIEVSNSSTIEFNKCIEIIRKRNSVRKNAEADKVLIFETLVADIRSEIISLSPSDFTMHAFDNEISTLITEYGSSSKKIVSKSPNSKSVALLLRLGLHRAILGADLEVKNNNTEGWLNILDYSQAIDGKSTLFKIPHHGSFNGYHERIWVELLHPNPISKLTPWNKNKKLPEVEMLNKYMTHTEHLFMTSPLVNDKPKKRDKSIDKTIKKMSLKIKEIKFSKGLIRCRIDMLNKNGIWEVALDKNAFHVNSMVG